MLPVLSGHSIGRVTRMQNLCSGCGLDTPSGTAGCQAIFDQLAARALSNPTFARVHRLVVDTYSLQHPPYIESAKSMAAHACGVCVALEHRNDQNLIYSIHLWLNGPARFEKPAVPEFRGNLCIDSLASAPAFAHYAHADTTW